MAVVPCRKGPSATHRSIITNKKTLKRGLPSKAIDNHLNSPHSFCRVILNNHHLENRYCTVIPLSLTGKSFWTCGFDFSLHDQHQHNQWHHHHLLWDSFRMCVHSASQWMRFNFPPQCGKCNLLLRGQCLVPESIYLQKTFNSTCSLFYIRLHAFWRT